MKRAAILVALLTLALPQALPAQSKTFTVSVAAGKQERVNAPIRVLLELPVTLAQAQNVTIQDAAGKSLPGQLTALGLNVETPATVAIVSFRELHFVVPRLAAGATATYKVAVTAEKAKTAGPAFTWSDTPGVHLDLLFDSRPVLRYMYQPLDESSKEKREQTFKVFHHLFDPTGQRLVTKGPGGQFTHHRGLFYGFNRITYGNGKKADIWHCTGNVHQAHASFEGSEAGPVLGRHLVSIAWHGQDKEVFATELRELTAYHVPGGQLIEFASQLVSKSGKVRLDGDPQHAGFHFRADNEVSEKTKGQTYFLRPDGQGKPGETRNWDPKTRKGPVNLPWNAMSFVLGTQRYTVAYLDKPTNPKEARGSERDYGRFGNYFEFDLDDGKPLNVHYSLWLQMAEMKGEAVAGLSGNFVAPPTVTVK